MALQRQKKFQIGEKVFVANFPNIGQIIDLESLKQALTSNRYGQMAMSGIASMYYALDLVDAIAFYQIVVPEVAKFYDIRNYASLAVDKINNLLSAYQTQIKPWFESTLSELKGDNVEERNNDGATESKIND
jgi:hypothetical protein